MDIKLHILNTSGCFYGHVEKIESEFKKTVKRVKSLIPVGGVDIVVYDKPSSVIPEIGIGGYTPNAHLIFISLDPKNTDIGLVLNTQFQRLLAHELHHALRWRDPGFGETLFDSLITEGLADHFDLEVENNTPQIWDTALSKEQIKVWLDKAQAEFVNKEYHHSDWFFGSKERGIPKWTGYSLGYFLVGEYLKKHPTEKPSSLVNKKIALFDWD